MAARELLVAGPEEAEEKGPISGELGTEDARRQGLAVAGVHKMMSILAEEEQACSESCAHFEEAPRSSGVPLVSGSIEARAGQNRSLNGEEEVQRWTATVVAAASMAKLSRKIVPGLEGGTKMVRARSSEEAVLARSSGLVSARSSGQEVLVRIAERSPLEVLPVLRPLQRKGPRDCFAQT